MKLIALLLRDILLFKLTCPVWGVVHAVFPLLLSNVLHLHIPFQHELLDLQGNKISTSC
jgi:hypothetical protein